MWEHTNKGGASFISCWVARPRYVGIYRSNLKYVTTNLDFFANWNDRISSYETFNFRGKTMKFYDHTYYDREGRVLTQVGSGYVADLSKYFEHTPTGMSDIISSFKTISSPAYA